MIARDHGVRLREFVGEHSVSSGSVPWIRPPLSRTHRTGPAYPRTESFAGGGNDSAACAHREAGRPAQELRVRDGRGSAGGAGYAYQTATDWHRKHPT